MMRNPLSAIGRGIKGVFTMRWAGQGRPWWSAGWLPATRFDYAKEVGDGSRSNIIVAVVNWIARTFPEAPLVVVDEKADGSRERLPGHEMVRLIEKPNAYYSGALLWKATVADVAFNGNGYWLKVRSASGKVVQLWWAPSSLIEPKWPEDGLTFISHYEYKPDPLRDPIKVAEQDVIHFRDDIDPDNLRKGRSQLYSLMREIFTDEEAANLTATLMRNMGIPGVVLAPKGPSAGVSPEAAEKIKEDFKAKFGGDRRGEPMVMTAPTDVSVLSFSPEQMNLRNLRRVPEERVTAVFGVAAVVVGLGAGLDRSTFTNFHEAREAAYEGNIIPTQKLRAADLRTQLLPDFDKRPSLDVEFDLSRVRVLQPDMDQLFTRMGAGVNAGFVMVSDARRAVGLPVNPEHDIFIRPMNMIEIPASGGKAAQRSAVKAAKARTVAARRRLARAHRSLFEGVAASLVEREEKDIMPLARRLLGPKALKAHGTKAMADFVAANDAYYENYPAVVKKAMLPVVMTYGEAVQGIAAAEVGVAAAMTPEMMAFLDAYAEGIGTFWASSSRGQIRSVVEDAIAKMSDPVEALSGRFTEWAEKRPGKTGDWETSRLGSAVSTETYRKAGLSARWVAGADACPICDDMDGQTVTDLEPPLHTGCLPGDSRVAAQGVTATSKRWYDGNLLIIHTAAGHEFSCTPNHPVLTPMGWLPAGALDVGGHVVGHSRRDWEVLLNENGEHMPARIEDVVEAFLSNPQVVSVPVPVAAEDFHGDGVGSEIAVIGANGALRDGGYAPLGKQAFQGELVGGSVQTPLLSRLSGQTLFSEGFSPTSGGNMGSLRLGAALGGSQMRGSNQPRGAVAASRDASFFQSPLNDGAANAEASRDNVLRFPLNVTPDQIVAVKSVPFHGYVYNLQTIHGFYTAEGIIAHNCACTVEPA